MKLLLQLFVVIFFGGCVQKEDVVQSASAATNHTTSHEAFAAAKPHDLPLPKRLPGSLSDSLNGKGSKVNLLPLIEKAQRKLDSLPALEYFYHNEKSEKKKKKGKHATKGRIDYDIDFAVGNLATGEIELVKIPRSSAQKATTTVPLKKGPFTLTFKKWNGCNTPFEVKKPDGYVVLALRCLLGKGKNIESLVYTPYTKDIDTEELRGIGYTYLQKKLVDAASDLKRLNVASLSFPKELSSDAVPISVAFRLALIEHIEPSLIRTVPVAELVNKVLVIVAANQGDAYSTSMSKAGAYGQFQFIPKTYKVMVARYPKARLITDFRSGMRDHLNAAKASLLLFDSDLAVADPPLRHALRAHPNDLALYLAASYNGGAGKAVKAIKKNGGGFTNGTWRHNLFPETRNYLDKIEEVNKVLK